jgi:hypothetical protein
MDTVHLNDIHLGPTSHDVQFSEEDMESLRSQLDTPPSPPIIGNPGHVDLALTHHDVMIVQGDADAQLQPIENVQHSTSAPVNVASLHSSAEMPLSGSDAPSVGLKTDSGNPPLFSTHSEFDDFFKAVDPPMRAIEHHLSPKLQTISTFAATIYSEPEQPVVHDHHYQQPQQLQDPRSADHNAPFYAHQIPPVADHSMVAGHIFSDGRRRSQSVPPGIEHGMPLQRRLDGHGVEFGMPLSTPDPRGGHPSRQVQGSGWRCQPYMRQDSGQAIGGGRYPIWHQTDGGVYAPPHMRNVQTPHNHPHSAPLTAPCSPTVHGSSFTIGAPSTPLIRKQNSGAKEDGERRMGKKQKTTERQELQSVQNHYLDVVMLHLQSMEQMVKESVEQAKWSSRSDEELERYAITFE